MQFKRNKPFIIMQIADTQEGKNVSRDTLRLINAALDRAEPDLAVFSGDQIQGESPAFKSKNAYENVKRTLTDIIRPLEERGVPFAATFGNHDSKSKISKKEQAEIYKSFKNCVDFVVNEEDCGTYTIPIKSSGGEKTVFNIYMVDSGGETKGGGYGPVTERQIDWYRRERDRLKDENGDYVPSMVFQHIPVEEYYNILKKADKKTPGAVRAFRKYKNQFFILDDKKVWQKESFQEYPAVPDINTGEFAAMKEKGDVFAIYVGHDHKNSFAGTHDGMDLGYTPGAGFNNYGMGADRGVRVFEINEENPREYKTYTLSFRELIGPNVEKPFRDFVFAHIPTTVDAAVLLGKKVLGALAGAALTAAVLYLIIKN
ncbi:MAG: metallophosphoesterase family protein [Oscillospiraceae bacterium]|nr:metallophosphoesterase family protein [Oscillospiraceae bacterium]